MLYIVAEENSGDIAGCGPVVILSSEWLTPKKSEAFWPNTKNNTQFNKLLQKHETPNDDWALIKIKRKFFESDDILVARKKAREAENTSDLTDGELNNDSSRRIIRKRVTSSSDNDDDDDGDVFRHRRQINQQKRNIFCNEHVPDNGNRILEYTIVEKNLHHTASSTSAENSEINRNRILISPNTLSSSGNPEINRNRLLESSNTLFSSGNPEINRNRILESYNTSVSSGNRTLIGPGTNFEYSTTQMLISIQEQNKIILEWIRQQNQKECAPKSTLLELPVNFPLTNDEELQAIEEFLASDKNFGDLCDYFGAFAGQSVTETVNQIMKHSFSNKLAVKYSYKGKKGKRPFEDLNIKTVIVRATKKIFKLIQEKPIEDNLKVWLKHAPQRMALEEKKIKARLERTV